MVSLSKKIKVRTILKDKKITIKIPEVKKEKVFDDESLFFKTELEETKRNLFLK